jgi:DNA-binding transcriptional LysR family regulator
MERLEDLHAFAAVVRGGSLTAAARALGRSLQSVSRSLASLERELGVELVHRTTRRSSPTDAGLSYFRRVELALSDLDEARSEATRARREPSGLLRIGASTLFGPAHLVPAIAAFLARHPRLAAELQVGDELVDLLANRLDLTVRVGALPSSALKARRVAELRQVFFAAPGYLARLGRPARPEELARHACVVWSGSRRGAAWPFRSGGEERSVAVSGPFRTSSLAAMIEAVAQGLGVGLASRWQVRAHLDRGDVEAILADFAPPPLPVHAIWPASRVTPAATRLFVAFLAERLRLEEL